MAETNISAPLGDTIDLDGTVVTVDPDTEEETVKDISDPDIEIRFTAKNRRSDDDEDAVFRYGTANTSLTGITITDGANGEYRVRIPASDQDGLTRDDITFLAYDVELTEPGPVVTTIVSGRLALDPDVTRA